MTLFVKLPQAAQAAADTPPSHSSFHHLLGASIPHCSVDSTSPVGDKPIDEIQEISSYLCPCPLPAPNNKNYY